jgi:L-iditol 2-dehydrogenase
MKAAVVGKPGQVKVVDFPEPQVKDGDMIVEPLVCGICSTDVKTVQRGGNNPEFALGHEVSAVVVETTPHSKWKKGERVIVAPYLPCGECFYCKHDQPGLCEHLYDVAMNPGGLAERILVTAPLAERGTFAIPEGVPSEVAAFSEPLGCVVMGLDIAMFKPGDSVVVVGDGPMGLLAAGAARGMGASKVIVAGMTQYRLDAAARYYADKVVDISKEELLPVVQSFTEKRGADVVVVAVSAGEALTTGIKMVRPGGVVCAFAGVPEGTEIPLDVRRLHYKQYYLTGSSGLAPKHFAKALELLSSRKVDFESLITARFPFEEVEQAVAYAAGRQGLKAVVTFEKSGGAR